MLIEQRNMKNDSQHCFFVSFYPSIQKFQVELPEVETNWYKEMANSAGLFNFNMSEYEKWLNIMLAFDDSPSTLIIVIVQHISWTNCFRTTHTHRTHHTTPQTQAQAQCSNNALYNKADIMRNVYIRIIIYHSRFSHIRS